MQVITIQKIEAPPIDIHDALTYPDFLLCSLLRAGKGKIEPEWTSIEGKQVNWVFTPRFSGEQKVIASCPLFLLRPIFARFAMQTKINLYCGHALFQVKFEEDEEPNEAMFSLFVCNAPPMEIWMKLYHYSGFKNGSWQ